MEVLFFPKVEYNTSDKYRNYFPMLTLITKDKWNNNTNVIILCHGNGIKSAIEWCEINNIIPKLIVSMDGSILNNLPHIDMKKYNIYLLRQAWKCSLKDIDYNHTVYYSGTNHHLYNDVKLRDMVVKFIRDYK